ncbi:HAD family hydrolase [Roseibium porphyridii]|uniref:HAD family hydrolase n=1 Tax=Roseibium porphyridii TaxID=2866279 RepID=A0ABY8F437_9HYPH|nr:HAD family hydrolase [Roseibium sp. KMA01]WFE90121.1 HAD family hydrolase [Roseibium sp. KMA01]
MTKTPLISVFWLTFMILALASLMAALQVAFTELDKSTPSVLLFGKYSALIFSNFSVIFSFLALSYSINRAVGRPLTLTTLFVSTLLVTLTTLLVLIGIEPAVSNWPALAGALLMLLRSLGVAVLPPRGDFSGIKEAIGSLGLSIATAVGWWVIDPASAPMAASITLLMSWPHLIDGINAFADKVFHKAAFAAGARELAPDAFSKIAKAREIVIDKSAVMSGPDLMVTNVMAFNNEPKTLLAVAASAEGRSDHPVAHALRQLATQWHVALKSPDRFKPAAGLGVVALLGGQTVVIGTTDLLKELKIDSFTADAIARSLEADGKTVLRVAVGGRVVGVLGLEGTLRQDAGVAGRMLRSEGLVPRLFSGDSHKTREALAGMLGLELMDDPLPGEKALEAAARSATETYPLVLSLSQDRSALELNVCPTGNAQDEANSSGPIAVSDTDDIGAFPALKALATRRKTLAAQAKGLLIALWTLAGLCGVFLLVPLAAAPILFGMCLAILWVFARFSVSDTLKKSSALS